MSGTSPETGTSRESGTPPESIRPAGSTTSPESTTPAGSATPPVSGSPRRPRDRDVLLLLAVVVLGVLAFNVLSGLVPDLDRLLASAPVLIIGLVAVSGLVLLGVARRPR
ncbi:MAG: hypothetical protein KF809_10870 [Chloroflexi bacterium]|nr:hypothetical protein [Chloroflexota bacterium]